LLTHNKQRGTAIVVALFITALVAAIAVAMMLRLQTDTRRTRLILDNIQLNLSIAGSTYWAVNQLIHDVQTKQNNKVVDATPIISPINKMDGAQIGATIYDEQGKINLNNLQDVNYQMMVLRLIQLAVPELNSEKAQMIVRGIVNWITPGVRGGEFDDFYLTQDPPYQSPHQMMASVSELQLIKGMTPQIFKKIAPYLTALPETNLKININNAELLVIMSLDPIFTESIAKAIISARNSAPFITINNLVIQFPVVNTATNAQTMLDVISQYFLVQANIDMDDQKMMINTLLQRSAEVGNAKIGLIWQSKGTL